MTNDNQGWQVQILESPGRWAKDVWIWREGGGGDTYILNPDLRSETKVKYGERRKDDTPTLVLEQDVFAALIDALKGFKPSERNFVDGKLEGTERHLQDLRKLLKL